MLKKITRAVLRRFNLEIGRPRPLVYRDDTMSEALNRLKRLFPSDENLVLIDVGAAEGTWTQKAIRVFNQASFILFEPLEERQKPLQNLKNNGEGKIFISPFAAGDKPGLIYFNVSADLDGSGVTFEHTSKANIREIKVATLDGEVSAHGLTDRKYGIKLDTHGFEVPIIEGALKTLKNTQFVIIECYGFQIVKGSLLFWQMCRHMEERGFSLWDVVDIMRRPKDEAFWQCDAIFIPSNHPVFSSNTYQ